MGLLVGIRVPSVCFRASRGGEGGGSVVLFYRLCATKRLWPGIYEGGRGGGEGASG